MLIVKKGWAAVFKAEAEPLLPVDPLRPSNGEIKFNHSWGMTFSLDPTTSNCFSMRSVPFGIIPITVCFHVGPLEMILSDRQYGVYFCGELRGRELYIQGSIYQGRNFECRAWDILEQPEIVPSGGYYEVQRYPNPFESIRFDNIPNYNCTIRAYTLFDTEDFDKVSRRLYALD